MHIIVISARPQNIRDSSDRDRPKRPIFSCAQPMSAGNWLPRNVTRRTICVILNDRLGNPLIAAPMKGAKAAAGAIDVEA